MSDTIYASYPVFAASPELRAELFEDDALGSAADEIETVFKDWAGRRGARIRPSGSERTPTRSCWLTTAAPEDLQRFLVEFRRTRAGDLLDPSPTSWAS